MVRIGGWDPDHNEADSEYQNALAARGYREAFAAVKQSVRSVLDGSNPGNVADNDHSNWYRELFAPGVTAGIIKPGDLAGYRNSPVYIRKSMHAPPARDSTY